MLRRARKEVGNFTATFASRDKSIGNYGRITKSTCLKGLQLFSMTKTTNLCGELLVINSTKRYRLQKFETTFAHRCPECFSVIPGKKNGRIFK